MTAPEEYTEYDEAVVEDAAAEVLDEGVVYEDDAEFVEFAAPLDRPVQTVGRRKEAVVRVRLVPGTGNFVLNGRTIEDYFPNKVHQQLVNEPFRTLELDGAYDVIARITGGGISGQAGALRLGIARSLNDIDVDTNRPPLKKAGFLTRDPRVPERKKAGLKKARKAPQYSKR